MVKVFRPLGQYPKTVISTPEYLYSADNDLVFSVTKATPYDQLKGEMPYSEMDWLAPDELRLLGSILLCERRDDALIRFYPIYRYGPLLDKKRLDLSDPEVGERIKLLIQFEARTRAADHTAAHLHECFTLRYNLVEPQRYNLERQRLYWDEISTTNYVLLRGIGALLKAEMLATHYEFWEEATVIAFIAMEASFQLIVRRLKLEGLKNPNAHDAAKWLHEHFDKPFGLPAPTVEKYFGEFYEQRVMTLHPSSRFGDVPYAPLMHDDYSHLRRSLREIFAYLVSGSHGPDFYDDLKRSGRLSP